MNIMDKTSHHEQHRAGRPISYHPPTEVFYYTQAQQHGFLSASMVRQDLYGYLSVQLPGLLKEHEYSLGSINKIFAAQWLSDKQVVFGTKCNKIMVMNLLTGQKIQIPSLKSSEESAPAENPCGIHAIDINPSQNMLATGGESTNDLAVYRLPTFDPVCVGEEGHTDWIFDIKWLDDQFVVTGSRDNHIALWCIKDEEESGTTSRMKSLQVPEYDVTKPVAVRTCKKAEKVRALAVNDEAREIASLSLNSYIHIWDVETFKQKHHRRLSCRRENVCMTINADRSMYAVGSQSHVTFMDARTMKNTNCISAVQRNCGIRSVSFREDVLTIGTGGGSVHFYDVRAGKYLELNCGHTCALTVGEGWLNHDDTYHDVFMDMEYPNAIYTHCYDPSGTKLFTAGGPLPAGLWGNYAALWQ